jgi:hypothetical protein
MNMTYIRESVGITTDRCMRERKVRERNKPFTREGKNYLGLNNCRLD